MEIWVFSSWYSRFCLNKIYAQHANSSTRDPQEMVTCMDFLVNNPQPSYLRINKSGEPNIHSAKPSFLLVKLRLCIMNIAVN